MTCENNQFIIKISNNLSYYLIVEYYDLTFQQEQEIFSRVQLGVALTPAEKLQAIGSPLADFVHEIHNQYSSLSLIMDNKRAQPFQLITQSLHMIETEPEKFNASHTNISKYLKEDREVPENLKTLSRQVYSIIDKMINVNVELFWQDHKLSPVEFIFLTYIIAKLPKLPIFQYQSCLLNMKKYVWDRHDEVRLNSKVFNTLKEFVDNMKYEFASNQTSSSIYGSQSTKGKKRARNTN